MIELRPSVVKDQIESGMTRKELQEHYGLSPMQMQAAIDEMGFKNLKAKKKKPYVIVEEQTIDEQPINNQQNYNL